jgi:uncharacterized protein YndB with AHSA1/START domain
MTTHPTVLSVPEGLPFVDTEREFDAPVSAVFRAYTEPDLFAQWVGPRRLTTEIHEFDAVSGGSWRYTSHDTDGTAYGFRGVFHTVHQDALIVQTFEYAGAPDHVSIGTATFEAVGGHTRVRTHDVFLTLADRDSMVSDGMEYGVREGNERLDELLASILADH